MFFKIDLGMSVRGLNQLSIFWVGRFPVLFLYGHNQSLVVTRLADALLRCASQGTARTLTTA
jgi:hypothetical protein